MPTYPSRKQLSAALALGLLAGAAGGPPAASGGAESQMEVDKTLRVWRTRVVAGEATMVWTRAGDLDPKAWSLRGPRTVTPVRTQVGVVGIQWWDVHYHTGLGIPADTPAGAYALYRGEAATGVTVTVGAPAARRRPTKLSPGNDDAAAIEAALRNADVELQPGRYVLTKPVALTSGRTLRGVGAVLYR